MITFQTVSRRLVCRVLLNAISNTALQEMKHLDAWVCVQSSDIFGHVTYLEEQDSHQGNPTTDDAVDAADADMEDNTAGADIDEPEISFSAAFDPSPPASGVQAKPFTFGASTSGFKFGPSSDSSTASPFGSAPFGKMKAKRSKGKSKASSPAPFSFSIPKVGFSAGSSVSSSVPPSSEPLDKPSLVKRADVTYLMARAVRHVFAAFMWHSDIINDAMAVATHLKFEPDLPRPEVSSESERQSQAALEAFGGPAPPLDALGRGTRILVKMDNKSKGFKAATVEKVTVVPDDTDQPTLAVGQRLEAKDRSNPRMICKLLPLMLLFMISRLC